MNLGQIERGIDIGLDSTRYYIYTQCPDCKKERWNQKREENQNPQKRCLSCARNYRRNRLSPYFIYQRR